MVLRCPVCHSKYSMEDLAREGIRDELIELASYFGKQWGLVCEYCDCFRTSQWGSVGEKKKVRLLYEIKLLFERAEFEIDSKRYRTDRSAILGAIRAVCDAEKYGFKNHNYLKRVLMGPRDQGSGVRCQRVSAEGLTAREEKEREDKRRIGHRPACAEASAGRHTQTGIEHEEITGAEYLKRHDLGSLLDKVGKKVA